jgi:RHS repeat-associated protein
VTDTYHYYAFGEELASTGSTENGFRYTGEQWERSAAFYYLRARYMDPQIGRFVTLDPWQGDGHVPLSFHRYLYANGSPVSLRDASGTATLGEFLTVVAMVGILAANVDCSSGNAPFVLTKTTTVGPFFLMNGVFLWGIKWRLSRASQRGGYIIQTVTHRVHIAGGSVGYFDSTLTYQEAFEVRPGQNGPNLGSADDYFHSRLTGYGVGSVGNYEIEGIPLYYEGLNLPSDFNTHTVAQAGSVPATYTVHSFPGPRSNTVPHVISVQWNSLHGPSPTQLISMQ